MAFNHPLSESTHSSPIRTNPRADTDSGLASAGLPRSTNHRSSPMGNLDPALTYQLSFQPVPAAGGQEDPAALSFRPVIVPLDPPLLAIPPLNAKHPQSLYPSLLAHPASFPHPYFYDKDGFVIDKPRPPLKDFLLGNKAALALTGLAVVIIIVVAILALVVFKIEE
ncbi:hypothetical protein H4R33_004829 [Dimargaris cristalligena]|uniref:Uncharacterized protein n=1 Tax=Dimargaris cristalligena TaxID=215637 RepID=A0A4P9ZS08_9FUNG|nr:hypothetical protein H4R33_004829 [Dimargaris cristalligena]RKP36197.1 hypothetical protein BJ085DRAFT_27354 [Dimargaris cristalligena]|eukprot:RKP36197.1 hypothetical protein BJ085DRAFT_27354 [Dimargaris cristalligena]